MSNIILPKVQILDTISDEAKILIEQDGEINRFAVANLGGGDISINLEDTINGNANPINADTLNGYTAKELFRPKAGFIYPLAGSVIPEGFLLCDGAEYGRTEFPELFAAIGTIYGNGNGSTTFNVPNLQTRVPIGAGEGYGLGSVGGEATHTLTVDEMPAHIHNTAKGSVNNDSTMSFGQHSTYQSENSITEGKYWFAETKENGGSQPHNNMQPYTVVNYIIATGKDTGVSVSDIIMGAQALPLKVQYGGTGATNAADALKNLGGLSMELLWENASEWSEFAEQTLTIESLAQYSAVYIVYTQVNTAIKFIEHRYIPRKYDGRDIGLHGARYDGATYVVYRKITINFNAGTIIFNKGFQNDIEKNAAVIPIKIYGIKGVFA